MNNSELYHVKTKDGSHMNNKVKEEGSITGLQFDDEKNGLQGPVDLVPMNFWERILKRVVDIFVGIAIGWIISKFPLIKLKFSKCIDKFKSSHAKKKNINNQTIPATKQQTKECSEQQPIYQPIYHSQEEVEQLISKMKVAALYIAAGIRELSNTVITDMDNPKKMAEMKSKLKELSSDEAMDTINFMLKEDNRKMLNQETLQLLECFRNHNLIVNDKIVPINKFLSDDEPKILQP